MVVENYPRGWTRQETGILKNVIIVRHFGDEEDNQQDFNDDQVVDVSSPMNARLAQL